MKKKSMKTYTALILVLGAVFFMSVRLIQCKTTNPTTRKAVIDKKQRTRFDAADYDALLKKYVRNGLVNYSLWSKSADDLKRLDNVVKQIAFARVKDLSRDEQLAFYINAYNAITLKSILDDYPVKSIRKISRVWDRGDRVVAGRKASLNEIEHGLIRPVFADARVHFALVCAAKSCPPLQSWAYTGKNLDDELNRVTKKFLNDPERTGVDVESRRLVLSSLFDWYGVDFKKDAGSIPKFLSKFRKDEAEARALRNNKWKIKFAHYDWSLNE